MCCRAWIPRGWAVRFGRIRLGARVKVGGWGGAELRGWVERIGGTELPRLDLCVECFPCLKTSVGSDNGSNTMLTMPEARPRRLVNSSDGAHRWFLELRSNKTPKARTTMIHSGSGRCPLRGGAPGPRGPGGAAWGDRPPWRRSSAPTWTFGFGYRKVPMRWPKRCGNGNCRPLHAPVVRHLGVL